MATEGLSFAYTDRHAISKKTSKKLEIDHLNLASTLKNVLMYKSVKDLDSILKGSSFSLPEVYCIELLNKKISHTSFTVIKSGTHKDWITIHVELFHDPIKKLPHNLFIAKSRVLHKWLSWKADLNIPDMEILKKVRFDLNLC